MLDNKSVIPYNKTLLKRYQAHINVEWCNQAGSIKYLFKYINKGQDRASICFVQSNQQYDSQESVDEIKDYYSCRYISAYEASWRILSYDIHYRKTSVIRLPFHLPGQQQVIYEDSDDIEDVLDKPSVTASMFLEWMKSNQSYPEARTLFPTKFVWKIDERKWERRKRGFSIGRIHVVSPSLGEAYYIRILLNKVKGPRKFDEIKTFNNVVYPTFRDACYAYGLLDDDNEYVEAISEESFSGTGYYLRSLFATMFMSESMSRPEVVWERTWTYLSDDILYDQRLLLKRPDLLLTEEQIKNLTLFELEKQVLNEEFGEIFSLLTGEQRLIYEEIITSVCKKKRGVFFVYGYGGTGKTFLWKTLSASLRSEGKPDSDLARLLHETSLIIWDEAPMVHKHGFEAVDRSLKDIFQSELPFGGKVIVFGGDFRQILPVVPGGSRQQIVNASLSSSYIWRHCKVLKLTKNLRLFSSNNSFDIEKTTEFANWLLDIGEGNIGGHNTGEAIIDNRKTFSSRIQNRT
ncbi:uncharacterized protein LOC143629951 [Bidens hawaiensis]|uniref:uncharacterized protein LOC143629951 n=1 Tax=Bidens hawaiensis TaxID=980011 RepID=UPI004049AAB3